MFSLLTKKEILFEKKTGINYITVIREGNMITLYSPEPVRQSVMNTGKPLQPILEYARHLPLCLSFQPQPSTILVLGLGGGILPTLLHSACKNASIHVAELDPVMLDVARKFFGFSTSERLKVFINDAFAFVHESENLYDIIIVDTYLGNNLPITVDNEPFWKDCARRLTENGVLAVNLMTKNKKLLDKRLELIAKYLPEKYRWMLPGKAAKNLVLFAAKKEISQSTLLTNWNSIKHNLPGNLNGEKKIKRLVKKIMFL